jgi:MoxR-like ATPase
VVPSQLTETVKPMTSYRYTGQEHIPGVPYVASAELIEAVNLALFLKRPLLLRGEPGCGKTVLARHVAGALGHDYHFWPVKSTSHARDGLYHYDVVGRLRDAQLAQANLLDDERTARLQHPERYVRWGPLGEAFRTARPSVVLIDEIDKADIDFPNDLLHEMEILQESDPGRRQLVVEELGHAEPLRSEPVIFITSNDEKTLPDAFLRRCLFHYIPFPTEATLKAIVEAHFSKIAEAVVTAAITAFLDARTQMREKKASTSELIDWIRVLTGYHGLDGSTAPTETDALARIQGKKLPYSSVLIKGLSDHLEHLGR